MSAAFCSKVVASDGTKAAETMSVTGVMNHKYVEPLAVDITLEQAGEWLTWQHNLCSGQPCITGVFSALHARSSN